MAGTKIRIWCRDFASPHGRVSTPAFKSLPRGGSS